MEKLWIAGAVQEEKGMGGPVGVEIKEKGETVKNTGNTVTQVRMCHPYSTDSMEHFPLHEKKDV